MVRVSYRDIDSSRNLEQAVQLIHEQGLVVYPTDTLYGAGGDFFSPAVIQKLDRLKGRADLPYSVILWDIASVAELVEHVPPLFDAIYHQFLPGKYTFLLKAASAIDRTLLKGSEKIGIRIPHAPPILRLVEKLARPLITTSINMHGESPANSPSEIDEFFHRRQMSDELALMIDDGPLPPSKGSTIVDLSGDRVSIPRRGEGFETICSFLKKTLPNWQP